MNKHFSFCLGLSLVTSMALGCQQIPANQPYKSGVGGQLMVDGRRVERWESGPGTRGEPTTKQSWRRSDAHLNVALCLLSATQNGIAPNTQIEIHIPGTFFGDTLRYAIKADDKNRILSQDDQQRVVDPISNSIEHFKELCQKEIDKDIDKALNISR